MFELLQNAHDKSYETVKKLKGPGIPISFCGRLEGSYLVPLRDASPEEK